MFVAAIAGVLLLPDVGELEIVGVVKLRQKIEEQRERQQELEKRLFSLSQTVTAAVSQRTNLQIYNYRDQIEAGERRLRKLAPEVLDVPVEAVPDDIDGVLSPALPDGDVGIRLVAVAEKLRALEVMSDSEEGGLTPRQVRTIKRWRSLFRREIDVVESLAANYRADEGPSITEVERGVDLGLRVIGLLRESLMRLGDEPA